MVHQLHLWKLAAPILELLGNIDSLLVEENPLTLRYFFYAVHDLQLIHFLILLDYIELGEGAKWSKGSVRPPAFNASLRFEILQNPLYAEDDPDSTNLPLIRVVYDDEEIALNFCSSFETNAATLCDLDDFIDKVKGKLRFKDQDKDLMDQLCKSTVAEMPDYVTWRDISTSEKKEAIGIDIS